jgi:hypothetical protein
MAEIPGFKDAGMVNAAGGLGGVLGRVCLSRRSVLSGLRRQVSKETEMSATLFPATLSRPALLVALLAGLLLAATLGLWGYYGTAVFFEMVRSGWASCF